MTGHEAEGHELGTPTLRGNERGGVHDQRRPRSQWANVRMDVHDHMHKGIRLLVF